ncbi:hypothetical protein DFH06DRAFT_903767, partial [Mycena polygramma]
MPSILNLKFKGNKSFVAFSNLNDTESLTKTWKVCTKVASYLEQGQRLENLSWRLWHLQNLMVDTDNAKSKREFKKLSKCMGDKLDKEKGRSIEDLPAPAFTRNPSTDLIRQRAVEKERTREAGVHAPEHIIQRMQFTFAVEPAGAGTAGAAGTNGSVNGSTATFTASTGANAANGNGNATNAASNNTANANANTTSTNGNGTGTTATKRKRDAPGTLRLPTLFSTSFGPAALLYPAPSLAPRRGYGEGAGGGGGGSGDMRIARPTIELPLDELLNAEGEFEDGLSMRAYEEQDDPESEADMVESDEDVAGVGAVGTGVQHRDVGVGVGIGGGGPRTPRSTRAPRPRAGVARSPSTTTSSPTRPSRPTTAGTIPPTLTSSSSALPAPGAAKRARAPRRLLAMLNANSAPGGVKAECSNCGATHTPLWRRGLNDELNCNACGLYCKLHKRPRPKTMRNSGGGGEGRGQSVRAEAVDIMAQCYNCHTTATPLWRKDDEGKTVCNACGLYYKLHGSARPISMKSDVIRKRSRHDARRGGASASVSETPTASPGVSRRASPSPGGPSSSASASAGRASPTLAPDGTTTHSYDTPSELSSALGPKPSGYGHPYYHEQYPDALPFASVDVGSELDTSATQRANKRRRMSVDSASEPPSSAASYGSYADGYTSASSQFSMEFPFSRFPNVGGNGNGGGAGLRGVGGGNAFWHPPMMVQGDGPNANNSPGGFLHPPMLPTAEEAPMDYLHPPM